MPMGNNSTGGSVDAAGQNTEEYLVLLDESESASSLDGLRARGAVRQVASPRLVVFSADRTRDVSVQSLPGVIAACTGSVPTELLARLDDSEALFASAWALRHAETAPKQRPGEGLSWDAPGFQAPDPPGSAHS
jgi:hypothetical protein